MWIILMVFSFAPTLLGQEGQKNMISCIGNFDETDQIGVRMGDWKMVVKKRDSFPLQSCYRYS